MTEFPDEEIVAALEAGRGRGRNDYPVRAMWRALIAGIVLQHPSIQSLLRELGRNPALLELCVARRNGMSCPGSAAISATDGLGQAQLRPRTRHPQRPRSSPLGVLWPDCHFRRPGRGRLLGNPSHAQNVGRPQARLQGPGSPDR